MESSFRIRAAEEPYDFGRGVLESGEASEWEEANVAYQRRRTRSVPLGKPMSDLTVACPPVTESESPTTCWPLWVSSERRGGGFGERLPDRWVVSNLGP